MTHRNMPLLEMADMRAAGATWAAIGRRVGVSGPTARRWIAGPLPSRTLAVLRPPIDAEATWARLMGATAARFNDAVTRDEARMLRAISQWMGE